MLTFSALFALETSYMENLLEKENLKLGIEASYDPLTRLLNRRSMTRYMTDEIEIANDTSGKFCLVMLDIDDFKNINDAYGHVIGDRVLVARQKSVRVVIHADGAEKSSCCSFTAINRKPILWLTG